MGEDEEGGKGLVSKNTEKKEALKAEKAMRRRRKLPAPRKLTLSPKSTAIRPSYAQSKEVTRRRWTDVEREIKEAKLDIRLNNGVWDLRTPANQGIFDIDSEVGIMFVQFLSSEGFGTIHTPKIIASSSEGGSAVFKLEYKGHPACLAQSPQLHKQMTICGGRRQVFEIGPVFRAEDSYRHRHLCEFIDLDVEMEIKEHYFEFVDLVDKLFVSMFDSLNEKCKKELDAIAKQYPFKPLKYLRKTLKLTFQEGVQMLNEAGIEVDPLGDLNTESERKLGSLF